MTLEEFSELFDVQYNNITSNQAPGLNEYEKSIFLTKAQDEIVKNYFSANSKGNNLQQGFDDSAKRQADFSVLMNTSVKQKETSVSSISKLDDRSQIYKFPNDVFIIINESLTYAPVSGSKKYFQVIPLRYDEYTRLMSKPYKRPLKHQAWRLINKGEFSNSEYIKCVEIITTPEYDNESLSYTLRYIKRPKPIIVGSLDGLTINGYVYSGESSGNVAPDHCELDPILHEDILQRAVELAKIAWTATGQDNTNAVLAAGQRSE
jgi:hypothetical protein